MHGKITVLLLGFTHPFNLVNLLVVITILGRSNFIVPQELNNLFSIFERLNTSNL